MRVLKQAVGIVIAMAFAAEASASDDRPNILFILADDLGWSDLGCHGNEIFETPHLDKLAEEGMRFTRAYAPAPICSASRASLLTGKTPARLGFEFVTKPEPGFQPVNAPLRAPPFTLDLPLEEITIAEALGEAGYQTAYFGKWHLNRHYKRYLGWSPTHGPKAQGFQIAEEDFGSHPYAYWSNKKKRSFLDLPDGQFPEDSMTRRASDFLRSDHGKPFFLVVSHFYVHTPVHTRARWLHDHYLAKIPAAHPRREKLAHYAAMVTTLDHHVGELLAELNRAGLSKNTLVVFTSDNGGHPEFAGNAPLRGSKWNLYEGGIRVPFLVRWPGKVKPGSISDALVTGTDLFPTFSEIGNAKSSENLDGESLVSTFQNPEKANASREFIWHFPYYHPETGFDKAPPTIGMDDGFTSQTRPHSVLQSGEWKLVHFYENDRDELFRLPTDRSEQRNLSNKFPEKAKELRQRLNTSLRAKGARFPTKNVNWMGP